MAVVSFAYEKIVHKPKRSKMSVLFSHYVGKLNQLHHKPQTKNAKGGVVCYFLPNEKSSANMRFQLQTEDGIKCKSPFGISTFDENTRKGLQLSIEDPQLVDFFKDFDEKNVDFAVQNASVWFKQKDLTRDQIKNMYYPMLSFDTTGKGYPPRLATKLNTDGRNKCKVLLYTKNKQGVPVYDDGTLEDVEKNSELMVIVEASNIWFQSKQFGVSLLVTDIVVFPKTERKDNPFIWSEPPVKVSLAPAAPIAEETSVLLLPPELPPLEEPTAKKQKKTK